MNIQNTIKLLLTSLTLMVCLGCNYFETPETEGISGKKPKSSSKNTTKSNTLVFTQKGKKHPLDILFVIDYIDPLAPPPRLLSKEKLSKSFNAFHSQLQDVHWHIAFLNANAGQWNLFPTQDEDGPVEIEGDTQAFLTPDRDDLSELFENTVNRVNENYARSIFQDGNSKQKIQTLLDTNPYNFFREDASLAVILLNPVAPNLDGKSLYEVFQSELGHKRFAGYGFLPKGNECPVPNKNWSPYHPFNHFIALTKGISLSICGSQKVYRQNLQAISQHIKSSLVNTDLKKEYSLKESYIIEDSIEITFDPSENEEEWTFYSETNQIQFDNPPDPDTEISISYQYLDTPPQQDHVAFSVTWNNESKKLRLLTMIDHSARMETHRQKLALPLKNLLKSKFKDIDWQIALTHTQTESPSFCQLHNHKGPIQSNTLEFPTPIIHPDIDYSLTELFVETFSSNFLTHSHYQASASQEPLASITSLVNQSVELDEKENYKALIKKSFFKEKEALLAVLILTNKITGEDMKPSEVIATVKDQLGSSKPFVVYGIITQPGDTECKEAEHSSSDEEGFDKTINKLAQQTGGQTYDICEQNYHSFITDIGSDIAEKLDLNNIPLKHNNIIEDSIELDFKPAKNEQEWEYDSKNHKIHFTTPPEKNTVIKVSYDYNNQTTEENEDDE